jgi:uncharacterized protein
MFGIGIIILITLCIVPLAYSQGDTFKPSFDCSRATSNIEKTICGVQTLASLDVELDSRYKGLLADLPEIKKEELKEEQRAWLKKRNKECDTTNLIDCIADYYHQRIEVLKKEESRIRIERMPAFQKKYDFKRLSLWDIVANDNILRDLYVFRNERVVSTTGQSIVLSLYTVKYEELVFNELIPKSIIIVKSGDKETRLSVEAYQPISQIEYSLPKTKSPVLLIRNPRGGNAANPNPYYVISLERQHFLQPIGKVSGYRDLDREAVLIEYDDIWENGLGWLCHADSPGPIIIFEPDNGKLTRNISRYTWYYQAEIRKLNDEINEYPRSLPPELNSRLLTHMLQKFLIYRILGEDKKAWEEFNKDIRHYDNDCFYFNNGVSRVGVEKIPIAEIVRRMEDSLKGRPNVN